MINQFPFTQFRLALQETSKIKAALKPFFQQFSKNNINYIIETVKQLHTYLTDRTISLNLAFNSLFAVKFILDTGDFVMLTMVEAYLLPKMLQIASFQLNKQNKNRGDTYFIKNGYKGTKDMLQYYGFNFIRIACQIIMVSAQIKPKKLVYNQQIKEPSDFEIALRRLKLKGFKPYQSLAFYKQEVITRARDNFSSNLSNYQKAMVPLSEHIQTLIKEFLLNGAQFTTKLNPLKLAEKGEATISNLVISLCVNRLKSINLAERKRALKMINQFVGWGDVFTYFQINQNKILYLIIDQISNFGDEEYRQIGLSSVARYYNTENEKRLYYDYLLQSIRLWSLCFPHIINCPQKPSYIRSLANRLENKGVPLPRSQKLLVETLDFKQNSKKKQQRNNKIKSALLFQQLKQQITKAKQILFQIQIEQSQIKDNFAFLTEFQQNYDIKIQNSFFSAANLQYIINFGVPLLEMLQKLTPFFKQYIDGIISYKYLIQKWNINKDFFNFSNRKLNQSKIQVKYTQSEEFLGDSDRSIVKIIIPEDSQKKSNEDAQKLQKNQIIKSKIEAIASKAQGQGSDGSFRCQVEKPLGSLIQFYKEESNLLKAMNPQSAYKPNSNDVMLKIEKNQRDNQFSLMIVPEIQPKEVSYYNQILPKRANSFLAQLTANKHQIIVLKQQSTKKLFSSQVQKLLTSSTPKRNRSKSINNKFKQLLKTNDYTLYKTKYYERIAMQKIIATTPSKLSLKNMDETVMRSGIRENNTATPSNYERYDEMFQLQQMKSLNRGTRLKN